MHANRPPKYPVETAPNYIWLLLVFFVVIWLVGNITSLFAFPIKRVEDVLFHLIFLAPIPYLLLLINKQMLEVTVTELHVIFSHRIWKDTKKYNRLYIHSWKFIFTGDEDEGYMPDFYCFFKDGDYFIVRRESIDNFDEVTHAVTYNIPPGPPQPEPKKATLFRKLVTQ